MAMHDTLQLKQTHQPSPMAIQRRIHLRDSCIAARGRAQGVHLRDTVGVRPVITCAPAPRAPGAVHDEKNLVLHAYDEAHERHVLF